jgi:hypothetical protein
MHRNQLIRQPLFLAFLTLPLAVALHIVSGSGKTQVDEGLQLLITTAELVVGQNRFAFGLLEGGRLLEGANVVVRLYAMEANEAQLTTETKAVYLPVEGIDRKERGHRHADGTRHEHRSGAGVRGLYVAQVTFARPGPWGIEVVTSQANGSETTRTKVMVLDSPRTPSLGSSAPRSHNFIAGDVRDLREIDTSERPDPRLHRVRIAAAIKQRKPQVIVFATPQFCTTRMCGLVVEIVRKLLPAYGSRVVFKHQEIWQDFTRRKLFPTVEEWGLHSEPWVFMVDGQGIIRAKFEGLVTVDELRAALQQMLTRGTRRQ